MPAKTDSSIASAIREFIDQQPIVALATTSSDGTPNVAPMYWKTWYDDATLLVLDNFMRATKANIQATGIAAVSAWDAASGSAYQCKGSAEYVTTGPYFTAGAAHMTAKKPGQQPKGVVVLRVTAVFIQQPGEQAGHRIDARNEVGA